MTNMELPIVCVSVRVPPAVMQLLTAKNLSAVELHKQPIEIYGSDIMSVQMARKCAESSTRDNTKSTRAVHRSS